MLLSQSMGSAARACTVYSAVFASFPASCAAPRYTARAFCFAVLFCGQLMIPSPPLSVPLSLTNLESLMGMSSEFAFSHQTSRENSVTVAPDYDDNAAASWT